MSRRLTRKQIKHDEFVTVIDQVMHWLGSNWRQAAVGLGAALLAGLVYWGVTAGLGSRSQAAADSLSDALAAYNAPVGDKAPADATLKFATNTQRLDAAEQGFKQVASRYWLTPQARLAKLYLARITAERGDQARAIQLFAELASKRDTDPVVRLATLDLVQLRLSKGEAQQLVPELEAMAAGTDPRLPRDVALYELAKAYEQAGKPDDAARSYRRIVDDFPDSPYALDARQKIAAAS